MIQILSPRLAIVVACAIAPACGIAAPIKPRPVEVWIGGDDGLTLGLKGALENALKSSSDFSLGSGQGPETLVITIPTNLDWKKVGWRTRVFFDVKFKSVDDQPLGTSSGSCWENALAKCATQIVTDARAAAPKIRRSSQ